MLSPLHLLGLLSLLLAAALFGFFYTWVCSTMWGLDAADPRVAIAAMQAMNASVRNAVFAPVFFGTPLILACTTLVLLRNAQLGAAVWFGIATVLIVVFSILLTAWVHVPMNNALAQMAVPETMEAARAVWQDYSPKWQLWNQVRAAVTGLAVISVGLGLFQMRTE